MWAADVWLFYARCSCSLMCICLFCIAVLYRRGLSRVSGQKTTTRLISATQLLAQPAERRFICSDTHPLAGEVSHPSSTTPHSCWLPHSPSPLSSPRLTPLWVPAASSHGADDSHTSVSVSLSLPVHGVVTTEQSGITANSSLYLVLFCYSVVFLLLCLW